ncbi:MAG: hypothetical protein JOZ58_25080 [Acetobacteraceae bacterium]|nr:hypothetical protein [Acetobacteraceae bacterium]
MEGYSVMCGSDIAALTMASKGAANAAAAVEVWQRDRRVARFGPDTPWVGCGGSGSVSRWRRRSTCGVGARLKSHNFSPIETSLAADNFVATRHHGLTLGKRGGVKGHSRRQPVRAAQPLRPPPLPSTHGDAVRPA